MSTWTRTLGSPGTGVYFTIVYDNALATFTVTSLEGKFDLNALWWDDGSNDGIVPALSGKDNALNMNGSGASDWDGVAKLSSAGLGKAGETKASFISVGETATFSLADFGITGAFDPETGGTLGVRGTSVNGGDSFKLFDTDPVFTPDEPEPADDFPEWAQDISHIVLYFDQDAGDVRPRNDPDGFYTVKIDDVPGGLAGASHDLDDWIGDVLDWLVTNDPNIDADFDLLGAVIKGGVQTTQFYAYGEHNANGTAADAIPDGAPQIVTPPQQGAVNGPLIDMTYDYGVVFA